MAPRRPQRRAPERWPVRAARRRARLSAVVALATPVALALLAPAAAPAAERPAPEPAAVVPASELEIGSVPPAPRAIPRPVPDPDRLRRLKRRAARQLAPAATAPEPLGAIFDGLNAVGLSATTRTPPDSTGAIGPDHYLELVNSQVGVYARSDLSETATTTLGAFVGEPAANVFDPQIQWDREANRWLYVTDVIAGTDNLLAVGWSRTASPTPLGSAGWCNFLIPTGAELDDYPKLGHSDDHIIVGSNVFADAGSGAEEFLTARVWALSKPPAGDTSCATPDAFSFGSAVNPLRTADGGIAYTPVPANTDEGSEAGYVVAADSPLTGAGRSQIMVWNVTGPAGSPSLVGDGNIDVDPYAIPANVPQPGTANTLDALDARLTQAVARTDPKPGELAIWTQHTVNGSGGRSEVRWYELLPESLQARQQGVIESSSHSVFNAAISPTGTGDRAVIDYNVGGSSLLAEIRARTRDPGLSKGETGDEVTLGRSTAPAEDGSCDPPNAPCRWGDYAGASPDPSESTVGWGSNQVNGPVKPGGLPQWQTRNFALVADDTKPNLTLSGPKKQSSPKVVKVKAKCDRECSTQLSGKVKVPKPNGGKQTLKLKKVATKLKPGKKKNVKLKLKGKKRKKLKRALKKGLKSTAKVKGSAEDAADRTGKATRKVKIKKK